MNFGVLYLYVMGILSRFIRKIQYSSITSYIIMAIELIISLWPLNIITVYKYYRYNELNEAFRNFQQAGNNSRAKTCLKYVALSSMLSKTAVNPFDGREAKAFERDPDIVAIKSLQQYLQQNDLRRFEGILNDKRNGISTEEVLMTYIQPLRRRMREHVLLNIVRPYKKVKMAFLAKELNLSEKEVEAMVVSMILAEELDAKINQIRGYVQYGSAPIGREIHNNLIGVGNFSN